MIANVASPFVVNNVISANAGDGIVKQGQSSTRPMGIIDGGSEPIVDIGVHELDPVFEN